jgi:hypothetical protein
LTDKTTKKPLTEQEHRARGYWCPIAYGEPPRRCHGIKPCDDCPINWRMGADE